MPEVPAVPGYAGLTGPPREEGVPAVEAGSAIAADLASAVAEVFADDGLLATHIAGFEPRAGQVEMAAAAARAFDAGGVLLAEAGTGTGKTLAYLVPAILSRKRVLISTGTKNLQEQIYFKDIPALRDALGVPFTATCMKGRANYLCLHRLDQLGDAMDAGRAPDQVFLPIVREWSARTGTGDRAELEDLPEDFPFWNEVSAAADTCVGAECPRYGDCFVTRMRQQAAESDLVIVNHHLLCADAAVRKSAYGEVIPAFNHVVLDEAHQLEDVATQYFGVVVSNHRVEDLARDVERFAQSAANADPRTLDEIHAVVGRLRDQARAFFAELACAHRAPGRLRSEDRVRATDASLGETREAAAALTGALDVVEATFALMRRPRAADDEDSGAVEEIIAALARRAGEIRAELRFLVKGSDSDFVYFVEFRGKGIFLRAAPIDVSQIVRDVLLERMQTTILTSATLAVDGRFDYVRERLGISSADELRLASEFDFARQSILYLPPGMPDPRSPEFAGAAGRQVIEILKRTHGRAFVLFTSYATLRTVQAIAEMALDYPIFTQGAAPRSQLLRQFRETRHAVLFATSSFWQGVDVIGEALSCVIIDKLPFASPSDPVTSARIEAIRARGGEPFDDYQVPLAILTLQQGLGRLIRHRRDRGVLAVLDPRLRTKGYGRRFLASLPPAPVVHDLRAVEAFFSVV